MRFAGYGPAGETELSPAVSRPYLRLSLLLIAATASGALVWRLGETPRPRLAAPVIAPGFYMLDAELIATDDDGRTLYRVTAQSATQRLADGEVDLDEVALVYNPRLQVPWQVSATTGQMPPGGKLLRLLGEVVAVTQDSDGVPATIRTDYLEVDPETYVAFTERPVDIEYDGARVTAIGMRAFLKEDRLQLLSDVHGTFIPN